jgi:hypothetical protein
VRKRKHQADGGDRGTDQVPDLDHANLFMLASAKSLEPSNLTGGLMASNPDMSLE